MLSVVLAAGEAAADPATAASSDPIVIIALAGISTVGTFITALFAYLSNKSSKAARDRSEANAEAVAEVSRKVTSNHGHDNIGDKVDRLVDQMDAVTGHMAGVDERLRGLQSTVRDSERQRVAGRGTLDRTVKALGALHERIVELEKDHADATVTSAVSFRELDDKLAPILDTITEAGTAAL